MTIACAHSPTDADRPRRDEYVARAPERLVTTGFRCWMAGYDTGDVDCWEVVWREYCDTLGTDAAKTVIAELACWVRAVHCNRCRQIRCLPHGCRYLSGDECMALALISGWQHSNGCVIRASALNLIGSADTTAMAQAAHAYAVSLAESGQTLTPVPLRVVADIAGRDQNCALSPNRPGSGATT